jgi:hypothetical protein
VIVRSEPQSRRVAWERDAYLPNWLFAAKVPALHICFRIRGIQSDHYGRVFTFIRTNKGRKYKYISVSVCMCMLCVMRVMVNKEQRLQSDWRLFKMRGMVGWLVVFYTFVSISCYFFLFFFVHSSSFVSACIVRKKVGQSRAIVRPGRLSRVPAQIVR